MEISVLGIDLAKNSFQLHGVDRHGKAVLKKKLNRAKFIEFMNALPTTVTIAMEACSGAHYWGRQFRAKGHQVKLISPQFVKPFVKSQKNDRNDAEAIVEAAARPSMRFVAVKENWQQVIQIIHRVRSRLIEERTALTNQVRGFLNEFGITLPEGRAAFRKEIMLIVGDAENQLPIEVREVIYRRFQQYIAMNKEIEFYDLKIDAIANCNEVCKRLQHVPGVGPKTATAFVSAIGDARYFKNGRHVSAWIGVVPRQHSTGGKTTLLGITKRGDQQLRTMLVHGARAVVSSVQRRQKLKLPPKDKMSC